MPTTPYQYNVSPSPTSGIGPFGLVPGQIGLPSPSSDLSAQIPGLSALNTSAANTIASKLSGSLSPATIKALQDASARFGVRSGMPGSGLQLNNLFGNIAGFAEGQAEQGLQDYSRFVPTVSGTQTVPPALQTSVAQSNAQLGAAPSPGASQLYAQQLFDQYLQKMRGPGGGTGGPITPTAGTGTGALASTGAGFPFNPPGTGAPNPNATATMSSSTPEIPGWDQMLSSTYPELAGATPEQLQSLGINPWDLVSGVGGGGTEGAAAASPASGTQFDFLNDPNNLDSLLGTGSGGDFWGDYGG